MSVWSKCLALLNYFQCYFRIQQNLKSIRRQTQLLQAIRQSTQSASLGLQTDLEQLQSARMQLVKQRLSLHLNQSLQKLSATWTESHSDQET